MSSRDTDGRQADAINGPGDDLPERLDRLRAEGRSLAAEFRARARLSGWHPFIAADYDTVQRTLLTLRQPGLRFLEWGSATGILTIMADLIGFEAYGIELDPELVAIARDVAARFNSAARFATGSFLPADYRWVSDTGDPRLGTIGHGIPGYIELGQPLEHFDLVFGYPWGGEEPVMIDLMRERGGRHACLLLYGAHGIQMYRGGHRVA